MVSACQETKNVVNNQLQERLDEKDAQLKKVHAARRAAAERGGRAPAEPGAAAAEVRQLQGQLGKLGEENAALRSELAGLDMGYKGRGSLESVQVGSNGAS